MKSKRFAVKYPYAFVWLIYTTTTTYASWQNEQIFVEVIASFPRFYAHKPLAQVTERVTARLNVGAFVPLVGGHCASPVALQLLLGVPSVHGHCGQQADVHHHSGVIRVVVASICVRNAVVLFKSCKIQTNRYCFRNTI